VVGDDFRFATGARGTSPTGEGRRRLGFEVAQQQTFSLDGERVSSTAIREALERGPGAAAALLATPSRCAARRAWRSAGRTIATRPRTSTSSSAVPLQGVYAVRVHGAADGPWRASPNLGVRPTIAGGLPTPLLEVHLFDFSGDLYGRHVKVEFLERVRRRGGSGRWRS